MDAIRDAAWRWQENGGRLEGEFVPQPSPADDVAMDCPEANVDDTAVLPCHAAIRFGYRLQSKAFMLTYNSRSFSVTTWRSFRDFVEAKAKSLGARAWSACLEQSLHSSAAGAVFHMHAYFYWDDGEGVRLRNTDTFIF